MKEKGGGEFPEGGRRGGRWQFSFGWEKEEGRRFARGPVREKGREERLERAVYLKRTAHRPQEKGGCKKALQRRYRRKGLSRDLNSPRLPGQGKREIHSEKGEGKGKGPHYIVVPQ